MFHKVLLYKLTNNDEKNEPLWGPNSNVDIPVKGLVLMEHTVII